VLIGWSASFTYLAMQRYWPLHERRPRAGRRGRPSHAADANVHPLPGRSSKPAAEADRPGTRLPR
jgi:hypothetical protein